LQYLNCKVAAVARVERLVQVVKPVFLVLVLVALT
jgi:hypothetical protein